MWDYDPFDFDAAIARSYDPYAILDESYTPRKAAYVEPVAPSELAQAGLLLQITKAPPQIDTKDVLLTLVRDAPPGATLSYAETEIVLGIKRRALNVRKASGRLEEGPRRSTITIASIKRELGI